MHKNRRAEQENDTCGDVNIVQNMAHAKTNRLQGECSQSNGKLLFWQ
jgi:hypothetical protein